MNHEIKTLELATVYENQGYFQDALEIYLFLDGKETSNTIKAAIKRMELNIKEKGQGAHHFQENASDKQSIPAKDRVPGLIEQWLRLMVLNQRLDNFKKIKARF